MADILQFDEINKLNENVLPYKKRALPFDDYFGPMGIPEEKKNQRISFAVGLADKMLYLFSLAQVYGKFGMFSESWFENEIYNTYLSYVTMFLGADKIDDKVKAHIRMFAENTAENTSPYIDGPDYGSTDEAEDDEKQRGFVPAWYTSSDRADFIGENEANNVLEYEDYQEAIELGFTEKTWNTMRDNRVRDAHADTDGQTVDIDDYFLVGDEYGLYPGDTENLSADNTVNCRCWLTYS